MSSSIFIVNIYQLNTYFYHLTPQISSKINYFFDLIIGIFELITYIVHIFIILICFMVILTLNLTFIFKYLHSIYCVVKSFPSYPFPQRLLSSHLYFIFLKDNTPIFIFL
jgi:hypothetical protein